MEHSMQDTFLVGRRSPILLLHGLRGNRRVGSAATVEDSHGRLLAARRTRPLTIPPAMRDASHRAAGASRRE